MELERNNLQSMAKEARAESLTLRREWGRVRVMEFWFHVARNYILGHGGLYQKQTGLQKRKVQTRILGLPLQSASRLHLFRAIQE